MLGSSPQNAIMQFLIVQSTYQQEWYFCLAQSCGSWSQFTWNLETLEKYWLWFLINSNILEQLERRRALHDQVALCRLWCESHCFIAPVAVQKSVDVKEWVQQLVACKNVRCNVKDIKGWIGIVTGSLLFHLLNAGGEAMQNAELGTYEG